MMRKTNQSLPTGDDPRIVYSELMSRVLKGYVSSGLYVFDPLTGGGKTFQEAKMMRTYYPAFYKHIMYIAPQTKLLDGIYNEIMSHIGERDSLIKTKDVVLVKNLMETLYDALDNDTLMPLHNKMFSMLHSGVLSFSKVEKKEKAEKYRRVMDKILNDFREIITSVSQLYKVYGREELSRKGENNLLKESEQKMRESVRHFFSQYSYAYHEITGHQLTTAQILTKCPELGEVYPQSKLSQAKIVLATCAKCIYGFDPILQDKAGIVDLWNNYDSLGTTSEDEGKESKPKVSLFIFDESDACAVSLRDAIIAKSISDDSDCIYATYQHYLHMLMLSSFISDRTINYTDVLVSYKTALQMQEAGWNKMIGTSLPPFEILSKENTLGENMPVSGIFQVDPLFNLQIGSDHKTKMFLAYSSGVNHWFIISSKDMDYTTMTNTFTYVMPLQAFVGMINRKNNGIKSLYGNVALDVLKTKQEEYKANIDAMVTAAAGSDPIFMNYPTFDKALHSTITRFEQSGERNIESQIKQYLETPKNVRMKNFGKMPVYHVCYQGISYTEIQSDNQDFLSKKLLRSYSINNTPEKIIHQLLEGGNSVILSSATASSSSLSCNFDLNYLSTEATNNFTTISDSIHKQLEFVMNQMYPKGYKVQTEVLETTLWKSKDLFSWILPADIRSCFSKEAQEDGCADIWFKIALEEFARDDRFQGSPESIGYYMDRKMKFIRAYRYFMDSDMRSFIFFQNTTGMAKDEYAHIIVMACLVDGSYLKQEHPRIVSSIPKDWVNETIVVTNKESVVKEKMLDPLGKDSTLKRMLVCSYYTFSAGVNLQYFFPSDVPTLEGLTWNKSGEPQKKDIDGCYLSNPTNFLGVNNNEEGNSLRQSCMAAALKITMMHEEGYLSERDTFKLLNRTLYSKELKVGDKEFPTLAPQRAAFALRTMQQAVGRLCRTKVKTPVCHILIDEEAVGHFSYCNDKSATKEWRQLIDDMTKRLSSVKSFDKDELLLVNQANLCHKLLSRINSVALSYNSLYRSYPSVYVDDADTLGDHTVSENIKRHQQMIRAFKHTILTHSPRINSLDELRPEERIPLEIGMCYGLWPDNMEGGYDYYYEDDPERGRLIVESIKKSAFHRVISPSSIRFDVMMSNSCIRAYFESKGFATSFGRGPLALHPEAMDYYIGEIGEQAFLALINMYIPEVELYPLEDRDYEWADFVIKNSAGENVLAIDVKNLAGGHEDNDRDMSTPEKRKLKEEHLKCRLIVVNIVEIPETPNLCEITGLLHPDGSVHTDNMELLRAIINSSLKRNSQ